MLAPHEPRSTRSAAIGVVIAAAIVAPPAAAQPPPLGGPPVQTAQPAPAAQAVPAAPPAPSRPGPGRYVGVQPAPPGWTSPQGLPPGVALPYPYPYPYPYYYYPQAAPLRQLDYRLPPPPPRRHNSTGMLAGGVVMVAAGLAGVIAGAALVSTATNRIDIYCDSPSFPCAHMDDGPRKTGGALLMAGGAIAGAVGIPLWIIGAKMIPIVSDPRAPGAAPRAALVPVGVRIGAGTASVSVRF